MRPNSVRHMSKIWGFPRAAVYFKIVWVETDGTVELSTLHVYSLSMCSWPLITSRTHWSSRRNTWEYTYSIYLLESLGWLSRSISTKKTFFSFFHFFCTFSVYNAASFFTHRKNTNKKDSSTSIKNKLYIFLQKRPWYISTSTMVHLKFFFFIKLNNCFHYKYKAVHYPRSYHTHSTFAALEVNWSHHPPLGGASLMQSYGDHNVWNRNRGNTNTIT